MLAHSSILPYTYCMKKTLVLFHDDNQKNALWMTESSWITNECMQQYDMMVATNELSREMVGEELDVLLEGVRLMCSMQGNKIGS